MAWRQSRWLTGGARCALDLFESGESRSPRYKRITRITYCLTLESQWTTSERDEFDLITSVGWARKLSRGVSLGVEAIGEDLEGFWDSQEAGGGARLLAGPSIHVAPAGRRWQFTATGGPVFHSSDTGRTSSALRDLPPDTARTSYALKASLSIALTSER